MRCVLSCEFLRIGFRGERNDVGKAIDDDAEDPFEHVDDDYHGGRRDGGRQFEAAAQIDDWHDDAAQIDDLPDEFRQVGDPGRRLVDADFLHAEDIDGVFLAAQLEGEKFPGCLQFVTADACVGILGPCQFAGDGLRCADQGAGLGVSARTLAANMPNAWVRRKPPAPESDSGAAAALSGLRRCAGRCARAPRRPDRSGSGRGRPGAGVRAPGRSP